MAASRVPPSTAVPCKNSWPMSGAARSLVYKVDRLTRSLADFAKLVELFDQQGVSFVSITQSFNTTSSMGAVAKAAEKFGTMFGRLLPFRRLVDFQHRREISLARSSAWI
jgi:Resolvase, N terminal domain